MGKEIKIFLKQTNKKRLQDPIPVLSTSGEERDSSGLTEKREEMNRGRENNTPVWVRKRKRILQVTRPSTNFSSYEKKGLVDEEGA